MIHQVVLEPGDSIPKPLVLDFPVHDRVGSISFLTDQIALCLRHIQRHGLAAADYLPIDIREHEDFWLLTVDPRDKGARSDIQFRSE
eukprot:13409300-Heterocapsa_arctica.AAC.1